MVHVLSSRLLLQPADFPSTLAFYEDVLGLVRSREFGSPGHRGVVFFLGGAELELTESDNPGPPPTGMRLWLRVADAREAFGQVVARGATAASTPELKPWGLIEASIADPDGLELVLVEVPAEHPLRSDPRSTPDLDR